MGDLRVGDVAGDQEAYAAHHVGCPDQQVLLLPRKPRGHGVRRVGIE